MNKKGFTLIEVLAVISILAAISLIIVPTITGSISNSKKKTAKTNASNYISAVETYAKEQALSDNTDNDISDTEYDNTNFSELDNKLGYNGKGPDSGKIKIGSCISVDDNNCYKVISAELKFGKYTVTYDYATKEYKIK